jgi:hypothetical protein
VVFLAWETNSTCWLVGFPAKKTTRVIFPLKKTLVWFSYCTPRSVYITSFITLPSHWPSKLSTRNWEFIFDVLILKPHSLSCLWWCIGCIRCVALPNRRTRAAVSSLLSLFTNEFNVILFVTGAILVFSLWYYEVIVSSSSHCNAIPKRALIYFLICFLHMLRKSQTGIFCICFFSHNIWSNSVMEGFVIVV